MSKEKETGKLFPTLVELKTRENNLRISFRKRKCPDEATFKKRHSIDRPLDAVGPINF